MAEPVFEHSVNGVKTRKSSKQEPCPVCGGIDRMCDLNCQMVYCFNVAPGGHNSTQFGWTGLRSPSAQYGYFKLNASITEILESYEAQRVVEPKLVFAEDEDSEDAQENVAEQLALLREWKTESIDLTEVLPEALGQSLTLAADAFQIPAATMIPPLMAAASSFLPSDFSILIGSTNHDEHCPIFWVGVIGEVGAGKSGLLKLFSKPINTIQNEAYEAYKLEDKAYKRNVQLQAQRRGKKKDEPDAELEEPFFNPYMFDNLTLEGVWSILEKDSSFSKLALVDELAGLINGLNQYKAGKGNDRQQLLTFYDGGSRQMVRVDSVSVIKHASLQILGGVQPDVLKNILDVNNIDGFWPRFWWVYMPVTDPIAPSQRKDDGNLSILLEMLYRQLKTLKPNRFRFGYEASLLYDQWFLSMNQQAKLEFRPAIKTVIRKTKDRCARIALALHCIEWAMSCILDDDTPTEINQYISLETLTKAIKISRWAMHQSWLMYEQESEVTSSKEAAILTKLCDQFRGQGWISDRRIRNWWPAKVKPKKAELIQYFKHLTETNQIETKTENKTVFVQILDEQPFATKPPNL